MKFLFLFLDGIGLGADDPEANPLARDSMPVLTQFLDGRRLLAGSAPFENERATLLTLDARLGIPGLPQSATGQAALLTGQNVPAAVGEHYGPKPNPAVAEILKNRNLFRALKKGGYTPALLNAYPPSYFESIRSGRRLFSAIPMAAHHAGIRLFDMEDLHAGRAIAADFTGEGWRDHLGFLDTPVLTPDEAGERLNALTQDGSFSFFEFWLSDYAGHRQDMARAVGLLNTIDQVLASLIEAWDEQGGLILIVSDHGNMEDLTTRRHTTNPVPALIIGQWELRREFSSGLTDLTAIAPAVIRLFQNYHPSSP